MWKTQDGESLVMTEAMLEAMAGETDAGSCPHCAREAVADEVGRMVRGARRTGSARSRRTGKRYSVYGGRKRGRRYRIFSRPAVGRGGVIAGVDYPDGGGAPDCDPDDDTCDGPNAGDTSDELKGTVLGAMLDRG
jgi:hypothetical protein